MMSLTFFSPKDIFPNTRKSFIKSLVSHDLLITTERVEERERNREGYQKALVSEKSTRPTLLLSEIYATTREYSSFKRETSLHVSSLIQRSQRYDFCSSIIVSFTGVESATKENENLSSAFDAGAVSGTTTSKTRRSSSNRWYCSNNTSASSSNNNEKEEFEKIKKLSNTTNNNNEEKKKTKSYSYALVTKRTPPRKDLGTFRFADDQMACGVRVDLNESTFVISRVTKTYTLKYGRYVEDEKRRVEVESLERSLLNRQLGDVFKRS